MKNERRRTRELEMLSAFLDDALSKTQRDKLEVRLEQEPELRLKLQNLQKTKIILGRLPRLTPPRDFMLTPDMVANRKPARRPLFTSMRMATALAALLLVVVLGSDLLIGSGFLTNRFLADQATPEFAAAGEISPQPLIQWGDTGAYGKGGAGEESLSYSGEMGTYSIASHVVEMEGDAEAAVAEEVYSPEIAEEMSAVPQEAHHVDGKDLILGINSEHAGQIIDRPEHAGITEQPVIKWRSIIRWVEISLGVVFVGSALTWWFLRKRFR